MFHSPSMGAPRGQSMAQGLECKKTQLYKLKPNPITPSIEQTKENVCDEKKISDGLSQLTKDDDEVTRSPGSSQTSIQENV